MSDNQNPTPEAAPVATPELQPGQAAPPADGGVPEASAQPAEVVPPQPNPEEEARARNRKEQRFSELSRAKNEAEREAAYWRGIAEGKGAVQNGQPQPAQAPVPQGDGRPDPANYPAGEFDPGFIEALVDWKADQKLSARETQAAEARAFEEAKGRFVAAHDACLDAGYEQGADFLVQIGRTPQLADAISESASPPIAAEYFARNPREWAEVARLSPTRRAVEIDRIVNAVSAKLRATTQPTPAPQAQPAPNGAPTPQPTVTLQATPTVNGRGGPATLSDPNKGSVEDYIRWRQSQG